MAAKKEKRRSLQQQILSDAMETQLEIHFMHLLKKVLYAFILVTAFL